MRALLWPGFAQHTRSTEHRWITNSATGICIGEPVTPPKTTGICPQRPSASPRPHGTPAVKLVAGCWVWKGGLSSLGVPSSFRDTLNHLWEHLCAWGKKEDERERVRGIHMESRQNFPRYSGGTGHGNLDPTLRPAFSCTGQSGAVFPPGLKQRVLLL